MFLERPKKNKALFLSLQIEALQSQASTGPEQDFLCVLILTGKNLFSLQGTPFLIADKIHYREPLFSLQIKFITGNSL